eukprot:TRINITY_DN2766_c0_g1_i1.p1 TRINITY_DN2766_c0_g1~~TRINITY_DN2766_c0_g1_i1.p1  ORF type:complete len:349 (+),score=60.13 TRINITY_DN2766_c0_g1_i1:203-1249(+)
MTGLQTELPLSVDTEGQQKRLKTDAKSSVNSSPQSVLASVQTSGTNIGMSPPPPQTCSECQEEGAAVKYRCPRCDARTCSLACVKRHKAGAGSGAESCSGKRARTNFVPLADFTDNHLLSDYNLLEEALQQRDAALRLSSQMGGAKKAQGGGSRQQRAPQQQQQRLPFGMATLREQAKLRGTTLVFLAPGMTRREQNTSQYQAKQQKILWRIEWLFPVGETTLRVVESKLDEASSLLPSMQRRVHQWVDSTAGKKADTTAVRALFDLANAPAEEVCFLMKVEPAPANRKEYRLLEPLGTLAAALTGCVVIEFPTIIVVQREKLTAYALAPSKVTAPTAASPSPFSVGT